MYMYHILNNNYTSKIVRQSWLVGLCELSNMQALHALTCKQGGHSNTYKFAY